MISLEYDIYMIRHSVSNYDRIKLDLSNRIFRYMHNNTVHRFDLFPTPRLLIRAK